MTPAGCKTGRHGMLRHRRCRACFGAERAMMLAVHRAGGKAGPQARCVTGVAARIPAGSGR
jgi:hypothetical protein